MPNSIPFLRDVRNTSNQNWKKSQLGLNNDFALSPTVGKALACGQPVRRAKSRELRRRAVRERGW